MMLHPSKCTDQLSPHLDVRHAFPPCLFSTFISMQFALSGGCEGLEGCQPLSCALLHCCNCFDCFKDESTRVNGYLLICSG